MNRIRLLVLRGCTCMVAAIIAIGTVQAQGPAAGVSKSRQEIVNDVATKESSKLKPGIPNEVLRKMPETIQQLDLTRDAMTALSAKYKKERDAACAGKASLCSGMTQPNTVAYRMGTTIWCRQPENFCDCKCADRLIEELRNACVNECTASQGSR